MTFGRSIGELGWVLLALTAAACGSSGSGGGRHAGTGDDAGSAADGASGGDGSSPGDAGSGGGASASGGKGGASGKGTGGKSGAGGGAVTSVTPIKTGQACASERLTASTQVLDIFIMQDRSRSMLDQTAAGPTKWEVITGAIGTFVNDTESAGIGAGIGFFGNNGLNSTCDAADYSTPAVPIANLNGNAPNITGAIAQIAPDTNTPTEPALQGALDYAAQWKQSHPAHRVIVVFATDGLPNGCGSTVDGAAAIADAGVQGPPGVETYVIGVFGEEDCPGGLTQQCDVVTNVNRIATAGGTGTAFIVDTGGDTGAQFVGAMSAIRNANQLGCAYDVPAPTSGTVDFSRASVVYTPGGGSAISLPFKAANKCGTTEGWHYDRARAPNQFVLCNATCDAVTADPGARIDVRIACVPPPTGAGGAGNGGGGGSGAAGGAGGRGSGAGGGPGAGGTGPCLLDGQSCATGSECCSEICSQGVCATVG